MPVTLWVRTGDAECGEAQRFMRANKYGADQVRDVMASPPKGTEWDAIRKGLGGAIWPAVDARHVRYGELLPRGAEDMGESELEAILTHNADMIRVPLLLTPKGALAGFRERKWRDFLDIGKGRA
ncbi:MAG: hypothetical protein V4510_06415 [bacterium]